MTKKELDFIGSMNMCDEISNEAYEKIVCHAEETIVSDDCVSIQAVKEGMIKYGFHAPDMTITEYIEDELLPVTPTQKWIPVERREPTQEEKEEYLSAYGEELGYMVESRMPDDGEEVLVSAGSSVLIDVFSYEYFDFENISVDEIEAWMPLPKPYKEKRGNENGI